MLYPDSLPLVSKKEGGRRQEKRDSQQSLKDNALQKGTDTPKMLV